MDSALTRYAAAELGFIAEGERMLAQARQEAAQILAVAKEEREQRQEEKQRSAVIRSFHDDNCKVVLDIGGQRFATYLSVLQSPPAQGTMLGALISTRHNMQGEDEPVFIDRDPSVFRYILNYFRNPKTCRFPTDPIEQEELFNEAQYYRMPHEFFCRCDQSVTQFVLNRPAMEYPVPFVSWQANQIHISDHDARHGISPEEVVKLTQSDRAFAGESSADHNLPAIHFHHEFGVETKGSILFEAAVAALPFVGLQLSAYNSSSYGKSTVEVLAQEEGKWVTLTSASLAQRTHQLEGRPNKMLTWAPRQKTPQSWKLVFASSTHDSWSSVRALRWYVNYLRPWCAQFPHRSIPLAIRGLSSKL